MTNKELILKKIEEIQKNLEDLRILLDDKPKEPSERKVIGHKITLVKPS